MKISLKRALKLRKELEALLAKIDLPTSVSVSLLIDSNTSDPAGAIKPGTEALVKRMDQYIGLSGVLAVLRYGITKANLESGVEAALAQAAHTTRVMAIYKKVMSAGVLPPIEQVQAEMNFAVQALANPTPGGYGRPDRALTVSTVLPEIREKVSEQYLDAKRNLEKIEDNRSGRNASVEIEIADGDAELLRQQGLI